MRDRIGLGWRPQLAAGILSNLDRIDIVEVVADDYFDASSRQINALETLAAQVPVVLHGLGLGMASTAPVERKRLDKMARLVDRLQPESWSEHLAFVRAGGIEIGHLAAPPRTATTIDSTAANLAAARAVVGSAPLMENIATLIDPPASDRDEPAWLCQILDTSGADLLLDLHNLYANSVNFGLDPADFLSRLPAERIHAVHISGGKFIGRILDDHLHDPPDPVYDLLAALAATCPNPLTVILERDGAYPPMSQLLAQLDRARAGGRTRQSRMNTPAFEQFLAGIYVDAEARARFLAAPYQEAKRAGLSEEQCRALEAIDKLGLEMAARSFARKKKATVPFSAFFARDRF